MVKCLVTNILQTILCSAEEESQSYTQVTVLKGDFHSEAIEEPF